MKRRIQMKIAKLCLAGMFVSAFAGVSMQNNVYADTWPDTNEATIKSAQPHFSGYTVRNIEAWDKETDPYSDFMRARVPLQTRNKAFPATQANPGLNDKTEVMLMQADYGNSFFNSTIANNSYGNVAFNFWQYTDYFCPWHGAATIGTPDKLYDPITNHWDARGFEFGIVNIPNQAYINAAHKNGVKAIACVYFDPGYRPGQTKDEMFVKDTNGEYVVANKLIELAKHYGIDGYFLNNEEKPDVRFKDFMTYLTKKGMYTQFYDTNSAFDAAKTAYLKDNEHGQIHNSVFVNYEWDNVNDFVAHANEIGADPYKEMFLGIEGNLGEYKEDSHSLIKKAYTSETDKNPLGSVALFTPSDMYQRGIDSLAKKLNLDKKFPVHQRAEYQWMIAERERMYFSGVTCDPKDTGSKSDYKREDVAVNDASYWPGVADFKAETSVIRGKKFYSDFNIGKGMQYFVKGKVSNDEAWTNLNDQDILPSWQWWFESTGDKLKADFDFGEKEVRNDVNGKKRDLPFKQIGAYNGGSSLVVYGNLTAKNNLRLFKTNLDVAATTKTKLTFRKTSDDNAKMKLGLIFEDKVDETVELDIKDSEIKSDDYRIVSIDLSKYAGRKIAAISLIFDGSADNYQMNVGSISVSDEENEISAPTGFNIEHIYSDKQMVFSWNIDKYENVDKYRVYAESNGKKHFLGGIYDEKLYVKDYFFENPAKVKFTLVKVGKDGRESKAAEKEVDFSKLPKDIKVDEITPERKFKLKASEDGKTIKDVEKNVQFHKEAKTQGKIEFSFTKGEGSDTMYEAVVTPIKEYTDDKIKAEYMVDIAGNNGVVDVPDVKDGYFYDLTIKPKNSEFGISYRGKFNDSFAKPMTETDVVWVAKKMVALRSPLTRDWQEVSVYFKTEGEDEEKIVSTEPYRRGITASYHSPFTLPAEKGELIIKLKDYKGNESSLVLKYNDAVREELIKLKDEYLPITNDRNLARILYTNSNLDNILDRLKAKLDEAENAIRAIKVDEVRVKMLANELKAIYGELEKNPNAVDYSLKLVYPTDAFISTIVSLKDENGTELKYLSKKDDTYNYKLEKGKKYSYKISSSGLGAQIMPEEGSFEVTEAGTKEIKLRKAAIYIAVKAKAGNTIKRLETINKDNYEVEVTYSSTDKETLPLSNENFTVGEVDTSSVGDKPVKVKGFNQEAEFRVTVIPNDTDSAEVKALWQEIVAAKELKNKAEYKYASNSLKTAFDEILNEAEEVIKNNNSDVTLLKEKQGKLKEAAGRLNGLSRQPAFATPSSTRECIDGEYGSFPLSNIVDGKEDTYAWFNSEQKSGDEVKLTFSEEVKLSGVSIIYPKDLGFADYVLNSTLLKADEDEGNKEEKDKEDGEVPEEDEGGEDDEDEGGEDDETPELPQNFTIKKADIEVKLGNNWKKIGEISGKDKTEVSLNQDEEVITSEVRLKITENSTDRYMIAEFKVIYKEIEKTPDLKPLKELLKEELAKLSTLRNDVKYLRADKDKKDAFDEAYRKAELLLTQAKTEAEIEESISNLRETAKALNGKKEDTPKVVYPVIPAVSKKEEPKETQTKQEEKSDSKPSELEITEDKAPKGEAKVKDATVLPSSKGRVDINVLKGLELTNTGKVVILQNKVKINVSITDKALAEFVSKKVRTLAIKGKNYTLFLNAKSIKTISRLAHKNVIFKVRRLETGKFKIIVSIDGKKLNAKELAKLKLKIK